MTVHIPLSAASISILDIGGGVGQVGLLVCLYFRNRGMNVEFSIVDISQHFLDIQYRINPFVKNRYLGDVYQAFSSGQVYDVVLGIDVFEHLSDYKSIFSLLDRKSSYLICNFPIEVNLSDIFRDLYMKGNYYSLQKSTLGHLHFISLRQHLRELRKFFILTEWSFHPYWELILSVRSSDHQRQLQSPLRAIELIISRWVSKFTPAWLSALIVQGSCYSLSRSSKLNEH
jgi:hypothetical protein